MTTVLEFVLSLYLGPPDYSTPQGVSRWTCPVCRHQTFKTMPDQPGLHHRVKCWNAACGFRGDAADMLKFHHANEPYDKRLERLDAIQREFEQREMPQTQVGSRRSVCR
jgi:hypothetical protein